jgi:hypothetical protein
MIRSLLTIVLLVTIGACSKAQDYPYLTTITGKITVADSVDASGDFGGFTLSIVVTDSTGRPDTLFNAVTDLSGSFQSQVFVPSQGRYPMNIGRYGNQLATAVVVLGREDTVKISAEFPGIEQTFVVDSPENEAIRAYDRVTRSYERVLTFLRAGAVSQDSIPIELQKWSDIYWEMKDLYPGSLASRLGIIESLTILDGLDDSLLVSRVENLQTDENLTRSVAILATSAYARTKGLDATLDYLQHRRNEASTLTNRRYLDMSRVQLLADSLQIDDAIAEMRVFERNYTDDVSKGWASMMIYDLGNLSLGKPMPAFSLEMEGGDILHSDSLKGAPYVLEIAALRDPVYQEQFQQMQGFFYVYNPSGVNFITIPVEDNIVVVDAFFEERQQLWPLAEAGTWREGDLFQKLNITSLPARFLVDADGNIIRKYTGHINTMLEDLNRVTASAVAQ